MLIGISHFHCPDCDPTLVPGSTRAICGAVIPVPLRTDASFINRNCRDCTRELRRHKASHKAA
jgi:hypothetical protein